MKVTVEEINGQMMTVVRMPFDAAFVKNQLTVGIAVVAEWIDGSDVNASIIFDYDSESPQSFGSLSLVDEQGADYNEINRVPIENWLNTLVKLPPLPRQPKPEDAPLLYRYMAEGIAPCGYVDELNADKASGIRLLRHILCHNPIILTGVIDSQTGERVEVAITDKEQSE